MPEGKHPLLPPASPGPCAHEHMRFQDGSFVLRCIDCGQEWHAVSGAPGMRGGFDYSLKAIPAYPPRDTRHDRWVIARTEPVKP